MHMKSRKEMMQGERERRKGERKESKKLGVKK
jgi:hypothetical protein